MFLTQLPRPSMFAQISDKASPNSSRKSRYQTLIGVHGLRAMDCFDLTIRVARLADSPTRSYLSITFSSGLRQSSTFGIGCKLSPQNDFSFSTLIEPRDFRQSVTKRSNSAAIPSRTQSCVNSRQLLCEFAISEFKIPYRSPKNV